MDALSWRWVFACVVPFALGGGVDRRPKDARRRAGSAPERVDYAGAVLVTLGTGGRHGRARGGPEPRGAVGEACGRRRAAWPCWPRSFWSSAGFAIRMLPLDLFRSRQFAGTNLVTLLVYAALGGFFFLFVLMLQDSLGYSALASGAALMPLNLLMLLISPTRRTVERPGRRAGSR